MKKVYEVIGWLLGLAFSYFFLAAVFIFIVFPFVFWVEIYYLFNPEEKKKALAKGRGFYDSDEY